MPPARWKVVAEWCVDRVRKLAPVVWRFFRDAVRYYWGIREPLKEYLFGFTPDLMSESLRQREVRLAPYESHNMAEFGPEGWKLSVPGRCVVCGDPSQNPPTDETRAVDDASRAFWTPLVVMLLGGTIGWLLLGRWFTAFSIPTGFVIGYMLRTRMPVRMRLVRCDAHATRMNIPQVLAWGNVLVVRFGHKLVRKIFRYGEMMDTAVPQAVAAPAEQLAAPSVPETIPLADSPHPDSAVIRYDATPTYEVEEPVPESKYPTP
ncbi:MAG TPA: hypothetical protein VGM05_11975 [Planctomycetaceae bacterium]|jgi:hypothetical protein